MTHYDACLMCGTEGPQVFIRMVEWLEPVGSKRFEVIPVCRDTRDCRLRLEQQGEPWPIVETSADKASA